MLRVGRLPPGQGTESDSEQGRGLRLGHVPRSTFVAQRGHELLAGREPVSWQFHTASAGHGQECSHASDPPGERNGSAEGEYANWQTAMWHAMWQTRRSRNERGPVTAWCAIDGPGCTPNGTEGSTGMTVHDETTGFQHGSPQPRALQFDGGALRSRREAANVSVDEAVQLMKAVAAPGSEEDPERSLRLTLGLAELGSQPLHLAHFRALVLRIDCEPSDLYRDAGEWRVDGTDFGATSTRVGTSQKDFAALTGVSLDLVQRMESERAGECTLNEFLAYTMATGEHDLDEVLEQCIQILNVSWTGEGEEWPMRCSGMDDELRAEYGYEEPAPAKPPRPNGRALKRNVSAFQRFLDDARMSREEFFADSGFNCARKTHDGCGTIDSLRGWFEEGAILDWCASIMCEVLDRKWGDQFHDIGEWQLDGTSYALHRARFTISDEEFLDACGLDASVVAEIEGPKLGEARYRDVRPRSFPTRTSTRRWRTSPVKGTARFAPSVPASTRTASRPYSGFVISLGRSHSRCGTMVHRGMAIAGGASSPTRSSTTSTRRRTCQRCSARWSRTACSPRTPPTTRRSHSPASVSASGAWRGRPG